MSNSCISSVYRHSQSKTNYNIKITLARASMPFFIIILMHPELLIGCVYRQCAHTRIAPSFI